MNDVNQSGKKPKKTITMPKTEVTIKQVESSQKYYLIAGSVLFALVVVGGFFGYRLFNNLINEVNKVKAQDKTIRLLDDKKEMLVQLKEPYNKIKEKKGPDSDADVIMRALPAREEYRSLIAMIENIANVSGVKLVAISPQGGSSSSSSSSSGSSGSSSGSSSSGSSGNSSSITTNQSSATQSPASQVQPKPFIFTVSISGPYDRIVEFLKNTEKSARVIDFSDMDLSGTHEDTQADLTMQTYWQEPANISDTKEDLK